jgi:hypothetical protein
MMRVSGNVWFEVSKRGEQKSFGYGDDYYHYYLGHGLDYYHHLLGLGLVYGHHLLGGHSVIENLWYWV